MRSWIRSCIGTIRVGFFVALVGCYAVAVSTSDAENAPGGDLPENARVTPTERESVGVNAVREEKSSWVDAAEGLGFGLMAFEVKTGWPEWNLGFGKTLGSGLNPAPLVGGGVSVTRPRREETYNGPRPDVLDDMGVDAWLGGCASYVLGDAVALGLEKKWQPFPGDLLRGEGGREEGRVGLKLDFTW